MADDEASHTEPGGGGNAPRRSESPTLEITHDELKTTFEYQVKRLQEIDSKAIEILKANLLLIGIVVTGGSILVQTDLELSVFINPFTLFGAFLLLASTGLAAVTYTASNLRGGLTVDAVETAIEANSVQHGDERAHLEFEEQLLRSYARWIEYNSRVTAVNDILATVTVLLVFVAFVYVVVGVAIGALGLSFAVIVLLFLALTGVAAGFMWIVYQMDHLDAHNEQWHGTFSGIRISKGTDRRQGLTALREMLTRSTADDDMRET